MSSISDILNMATSGLTVAQTQIGTTSDNIANVNTTGYARKVASQSETVVNGAGLGVHIDSITRAANTFLDKASLAASSSSGSASVISSFLDQAQQMFGDPSSGTGYFSDLDSIYSAFSSASDTPSSTLARQDALNSVNTFLTDSSSMQTNLGNLRDSANQQVSTDVTQINSILTQIAQTNSDISRISAGGGDASGSQNQQSSLLDQLSNLMQVQITPTATGGVTIRSQEGVYLAGDQGAATLSYGTAGGGGLLTATPPKGSPMQISAGGGEIAGLMQVAGAQIPQIQAQLSEMVSQAVSQINAAHNASTAVPPPQTLTGEPIGQSLATAIGQFSGVTTIGITNAAGVIQQKVQINFDTGTMVGTGNGGNSTVSFTGANFVTQLQSALGNQGIVAFTNGALSLSASNSAWGVGIADDATNPASVDGGEGFSQFFGLNNLISSSVYSNVQTPVSASQPNTFTAGSTMSLELTDSTGAAIRQVNLSVPAQPSTMGDVITALNSSIGAYGNFALDSQGHLQFQPNTAYAGTNVSVVSDNTTNTAGGPSLSQYLNIGWTSQAARTSSFSVRSDIASDPSNMAFAAFDPTQSANGNPALAVGDGSGAVAIASSGSTATQFATAGALKAMNISVSDYASQLGGQLGAMATNADNASQSATAVMTQATAQRSSAEGVNMDTELVNLTTYQQSYNASARLIQAAKDMYDTLIQMMN